ncbi:MAG: MGMT family protein [Candidatus Omnitrophica bacterium]|nr:MGMT family protein [Candidatus Omnitrophota bacterium]
MTEFQRKVFKAVLNIPVGEVRTYKQVATKAGRPKASRAVGQILNKNQFPVIIPCHRVVASSGKIGGYRWGVKNKKKILDLERKIVECLQSKE